MSDLQVMNPNHHAAMDGAMLLVIMGSFANYLPYIAAALAALWYCVLFYDRFVNNTRGRE